MAGAKVKEGKETKGGKVARLDAEDGAQEPGGEGVHLWLLVIKAYHAMAAYAAPSLRMGGLGDSDFRVLEALLHKGALPVNVIGGKVHLTPGSISAAVDRLLERGLVSRVEDKEDRRVRRVDLTVEGRKLIVKTFKTHAAEMNELAEGLSGSDRRALADGLKKLGRRAEKGRK